jgi:putative ABC transport system substrate-binding protein
MMRRRFITLLGGAVAAWPLAARAQQRERMRRIGMLSATALDDQENKRLAAFLQRLQQLGWTDGHNVRIFWHRFTQEHARRDHRQAQQGN